jgi:hypothetical protein
MELTNEIAEKTEILARPDVPNYATLVEQIAECDPAIMEEFRDLPQTEKWEVTQIQERHREIIRYLVMGKKNCEIAALMGVTSMMVSMVRNSKVVQAKLEALHRIRDTQAVQIHERIQNLQGVSIDVLEQALEDPNVPFMYKTKIAQDMLDRGGNCKVQKVQSTSVNTNIFTQADFEELKKRARENGLLARPTPLTIEAEAV